MCFVDIIKTDRLRIWPLPGWVRVRVSPSPAPLPLVAAPWSRGGDIPGQGGQARRPPEPTRDGPPLLQGGEPSLTTAPPHVRRRERSVRSTVVRGRNSGSSPQNWPCGPVCVLGGRRLPCMPHYPHLRNKDAVP